MTPRILDLAQIAALGRPRPLVGGKALALARLAAAGFAVPEGFCLTAAAYREVIRHADLEAAIDRLLGSIDLAAARFEEIWDVSLAIRNIFLRAELPQSLTAELANRAETLGGGPLVVRSSAPGEDETGASFAGRHESVVGVRGGDALLEAVLRVFASLWSYPALLYRRELGLDPAGSAMAVLVQRLIPGEASGVAFSRHPARPDEAVVEAAWGLNQGLVDGLVAPDRWRFAQDGCRPLAFEPAERSRLMVLGPGGPELVPLKPDRAGRAPLSDEQAAAVCALARRAEETFGRPQDVEWTYAGGRLYVLQSRPVTAGALEAGERPWQAADRRPWEASLARSFASLKTLRTRVEGEILPAMAEAAEAMRRPAPETLDAAALAREIERRRAVLGHWRDVYHAECVPLAHAVRLFGQAYNDALKPVDPFAFVDALAGSDLSALRRNALLSGMAAMVRADPGLVPHLKARDLAALPPDFRQNYETFVASFGDLACNPAWCEEGAAGILGVVAKLARLPGQALPDDDADAGGGAAERFLAAVAPERQDRARDLLDLARAAWRLRDDDNLALGRVEARLLEALAEGRRRLAAAGRADARTMPDAAVAQCLEHPDCTPQAAEAEKIAPTRGFRRLAGHPAGPGLAQGPARVIREPRDLYTLEPGEILVCDALDPNMTFVVPLAAGIVERRGGMLVHGAIIAREYGLPCVTGVARATEIIATGERLTVDGYRGEVLVHAPRAEDEPSASPDPAPGRPAP